MQFYRGRSTVLVTGPGTDDDIIRALVWRLWWHKLNVLVDGRADVSPMLKQYADGLGLPYAVASPAGRCDQVIEVTDTGWETRWTTQ